MTHYYLYIKAGQELDTNTAFYKVGIGESETQTKKHAWLQAYAHEHGHFFVIWSPDAVDFMVKCQKSIGPNAKNVIAIIANDLVFILRDGGEIPSSYQAELNRHQLMMKIDPAYYCYNTIRKKQYTVISEKDSSK
jgi:hypothetical protein